jgi:tetratricopeptide (TPR) repeat protein
MAMLASSAAAQSSEWDRAAASYGRGVHAYFDGRYDDAEAWLARALEFNPDDPRLFYFRALSLMRLGRSDEACSEMEVGAALEAERPNRYGVGVALQRVQGGDRLVLEKYRRQALAGALVQQRATRAQSESRANDESQVLYQPVIVPLDGFLSPGIPRALSAEDLARRAAVAESRGAPRLPPQSRGSASTPTEPNPFQDDTAAAPAQPAPAARSTEAPFRPAEEATPEDADLDEANEVDEGPITPSPQSPAPDSQDDPFQDFQ